MTAEEVSVIYRANLKEIRNRIDELDSSIQEYRRKSSQFRREGGARLADFLTMRCIPDMLMESLVLREMLNELDSQYRDACALLSEIAKPQRNGDKNKIYG